MVITMRLTFVFECSEVFSNRDGDDAVKRSKIHLTSDLIVMDFHQFDDRGEMANEITIFYEIIVLAEDKVFGATLG